MVNNPPPLVTCKCSLVIRGVCEFREVERRLGDRLTVGPYQVNGPTSDTKYLHYKFEFLLRFQLISYCQLKVLNYQEYTFSTEMWFYVVQKC